MKKAEIILRLLRIPFDFLSVFLAFLLAYFFRASPEVMTWVGLEQPLLLPLQDFIWFAAQAAILVVGIFAWERMYSLRKSYRFRKELRRMLTLTGAGYTVIILYFFLVGVQFFSRFILGVSFVLAIFFMLFFRLVLRLIQHAFWRRKIGLRRVLFIGEGALLQQLADLWKEALGFQLVGKLTDRSTSNDGLRILGTYHDLEKVVKQYQIDEVVQVSRQLAVCSSQSGAKVAMSDADIVEFCQLNHVEYRFVPDLLEVQRTNTEIDFIQDIPLITLRSSAIDGWAQVVKRVTDIIGSTGGLILLSPVFALIALAIKLDDGGPVFYKSRRVSRNHEFFMWKFRSMIVDADAKKKELMAQNRREGPLFKIDNDPRITRLGRFLRKTTLDELPQLWNVLKGELSLVGPRAHLPEEIARYEKHHRKVLAIKAGVTGLAQVSGRSKLDFEKEIKLDVYYVENWSIWMDLRILFQTFGVLLDGE